MLLERISELYSLSWELLHMGWDGTPVYSCDYSSLSGRIFRLCNELYVNGCSGESDETQALFYLSLLKGYRSTYCDDGEKQERIQFILDRCWELLPVLPASLLKVSLLAWCYSEIYDDDLAREAHAIMDDWPADSLTVEQREIREELECFEENQYPWEEIEE